MTMEIINEETEGGLAEVGECNEGSNEGPYRSDQSKSHPVACCIVETF